MSSVTVDQEIITFDSSPPFARKAALVALITGVLFSVFLHLVGLVICLFSLPIYLNGKSNISRYFVAHQNGVKFHTLKDQIIELHWSEIEKIALVEYSDSYEYISFKVNDSLKIESVLHGQITSVNKNKLLIFPDCCGETLNKKILKIKELRPNYKNE